MLLEVEEQAREAMVEGDEPAAPKQAGPDAMYSSYDEFVPHSRERMDCVLSELQCNCSHSCECAGSVPDKHAECATASQQTPWPWPLRVRCEDEGLQTACAREATCNAFGRMDNLGKVKEMLGAGMLRKCLDLCRCATITCWGILWF